MKEENKRKKNKPYFLSMSPMLFLAISLCLYSCGAKEPKPEPRWEYKPQGIHISYQADQMLNEFNGSSHALQMVIYQFDNINKFNELAQYKEGLITLLKAQNFDPSVQAVKKVFIDPGQATRLVLDRTEKSRWIGIVAGYFNLTPGKATVFFEIPHKVEKQGMIFFKKEVAVIEDIKINLLLKEHSLTGILLNE